MVNFLIAGLATFFGLLILGPVLSAFCRVLGVYTVVHERQCKVYMLFGKVVASIDEPGLHLLWLKLGWKAPFVNWLGRCHTLDLRLDQEYLRSQPVNSEEGAPMGIGIWYEMRCSSAIRWPICSRTRIRAAPFRQT